MKITATWHYGNSRHVEEISVSEFLQRMHKALAELQTSGREQVIRECVADTLLTGRGEYGWNTYTLSHDEK